MVLASLICSYVFSGFDSNRISLFGYKFNFVVSDSMEPTLNIGNIVITKISTYEDIKKGDIVTYSHNLDGKDIVVIHRVVEILNEGVITKGDNRQDNDDWIVPKENIISKTVANLDFKNLDIDF